MRGSSSRTEAGLTMIELLVTLSLFAVASTAFYQVLFQGARGSETARDVAKVSEEARLGLNRMIRDTREGSQFQAVSATSYQVLVDFNRDGQFSAEGNPDGDVEVLTYAFTGSAITLNGEVLVSGVSQIAGRPVFVYSSSRALKHDADRDGVATLAELQTAAQTDPTISPVSLLTTVNYGIRVTSGSRTTNFYGKADLRNTDR
jgi:prepilin-type N-terminal cleavage/methylation domain-containing protein